MIGVMPLGHTAESSKGREVARVMSVAHMAAGFVLGVTFVVRGVPAFVGFEPTFGMSFCSVVQRMEPASKGRSCKCWVCVCVC